MASVKTYIVVSPFPVVIIEGTTSTTYNPGDRFSALDNNVSLVRLLAVGKVVESAGQVQQGPVIISRGPQGPTGPTGAPGGAAEGLPLTLIADNTTGASDICIVTGQQVKGLVELTLDAASTITVGGTTATGVSVGSGSTPIALDGPVTAPDVVVSTSATIGPSTHGDSGSGTVALTSQNWGVGSGVWQGPWFTYYGLAGASVNDRGHSIDFAGGGANGTGRAGSVEIWAGTNSNGKGGTLQLWGGQSNGGSKGQSLTVEAGASVHTSGTGGTLHAGPLYLVGGIANIGTSASRVGYGAPAILQGGHCQGAGSADPRGGDVVIEAGYAGDPGWPYANRRNPGSVYIGTGYDATAFDFSGYVGDPGTYEIPIAPNEIHIGTVAVNFTYNKSSTIYSTVEVDPPAASWDFPNNSMWINTAFTWADIFGAGEASSTWYSMWAAEGGTYETHGLNVGIYSSNSEPNVADRHAGNLDIGAGAVGWPTIGTSTGRAGWTSIYAGRSVEYSAPPLILSQHGAQGTTSGLDGGHVGVFGASVNSPNCRAGAVLLHGGLAFNATNPTGGDVYIEAGWGDDPGGGNARNPGGIYIGTMYDQSWATYPAHEYWNQPTTPLLAASEIQIGTNGVDVHLGNHASANLGFYGAAPAAKPTITGSRGGNAALADLLTQLATLGLITDSTTA